MVEEVAVYWEAGRDPERLFVKADHAPPGATPRFPGSSGELAKHWVIREPDAEVTGTLLARIGVRAWLAPIPIAPPGDLAPETPEFDQDWRLPTTGLDLDEAERWPGAGGEHVRIADLEYSWDPDHEDLETTLDAGGWGWNWGEYRFHGNAVLGILVGGDNGYGILGGAPAALPIVVHPFVTDYETYDVAAAIVAATEMLASGDVLLIEQQGYVDDTFCPVSWEPGVFDAIAAAVAAGIVVVEPAGNGGADLDSEIWQGAFAADSGSIMVGSGNPPGGNEEPRAWSGSSYGARVDVQGWEGSIVTAASDDGFAELFFPEEDRRQAYTSVFGGTSGAAAQVAAVVAVAQSVAIEAWGAPVEPRQLRAMLIASGTPQAYGDQHVGPLPDLRRLLRTWFVP